MTADKKTLAVYNAKAGDYAAKFDSAGKPGTHLMRFIAALSKCGTALDLGCGPGGASVHMMNAGLNVDAIDASSEMVRLACDAGVPARLATFDDLDAIAAYDGVWANFSLLHAPRNALPRHLGNIARSLRIGGYFHIGMKTGTGERRDHLDRKYTFVEEDELAGLISDAGLTVVAKNTGHEVGLAGTDDWWVVLMAQKQDPKNG